MRAATAGVRLRSDLAGLLPPGPPPDPAVPPRGAALLAANESATEPLASVCAVIAEAAAAAHRYPDPTARPVAVALGEFLGVPAEDVVVGPGSISVLQSLLTAACEPGTEVVFAWRSFEAFPLLVRLAGAEPVTVPLRDYTHDLDAMAAAVTDRTRVVIVCNPNNPTGTVVSEAELSGFLDRVPESCLVLVDEAYGEFRGTGRSALAEYRRRPNVVVSRTFSKAYGLAGLRAGYLVAPRPVADAVRAVQLPYSVSQVAQAAALASLAAGAELADRVAEVVAERDRLRDVLLAAGWPVPPSHGNFVWLRTGPHTATVAAALDGAGVVVKAFDGEGIRVSIGTALDVDRVLSVLLVFTGRLDSLLP